MDTGAYLLQIVVTITAVVALSLNVREMRHSNQLRAAELLVECRRRLTVVEERWGRLVEKEDQLQCDYELDDETSADLKHTHYEIQNLFNRAHSLIYFGSEDRRPGDKFRMDRHQPVDVARIIFQIEEIDRVLNNLDEHLDDTRRAAQL